LLGFGVSAIQSSYPTRSAAQFPERRLRHDGLAGSATHAHRVRTQRTDRIRDNAEIAGGFRCSPRQSHNAAQFRPCVGHASRFPGLHSILV